MRFTGVLFIHLSCTCEIVFLKEHKDWENQTHAPVSTLAVRDPKEASALNQPREKKAMLYVSCLTGKPREFQEGTGRGSDSQKGPSQQLVAQAGELEVTAELDSAAPAVDSTLLIWRSWECVFRLIEKCQLLGQRLL